jgi:hypothetical protein
MPFGLLRRAGAVLLALSAVCLAVSACSHTPAHRSSPSGPLVVRTRPATPTVSVLAGGASAIAAQAAGTLFASSPLVVIADADSPLALAIAATEAERVHAPVLLASPRAGGQALSVTPFAEAEIKALHPRAVLDVGLPGSALAATLHGIPVMTGRHKLPATTLPAPLSTVAVLVHWGDASAEASAVITTARAAGARVVFMRDYDPRADPSAVVALSAARPEQVLALGRPFGPAPRLAARVAVAKTGVQLPGGGEILFPMHRLVCLYGHPGAPALGALGQQGLAASIARAWKLAALYRRLSRVRVMPAFEIIASVAQGAGEPEGGTYSYLTPEAEIRPWVMQATRAGLYVILDLQAGRASLLAQAQQYRQLLELPDVGLAIDPEWKLLPRQLPLRQIGSVTSGQVNGVANWLAALTAERHLPQKLLVLHQFRLSMLSGEQVLDTHHDDLTIVIHMDGQGTPGEKQQTWDAVLGAAPRGVYLGWKNFFRQDHPMLRPSQTMARTPQPVMISYQ